MQYIGPWLAIVQPFSSTKKGENGGKFYIMYLKYHVSQIFKIKQNVIRFDVNTYLAKGSFLMEISVLIEFEPILSFYCSPVPT